MAGRHGPTAVTTHVLVVAGSDSSGGAGLSRDVETVSAFGLQSCVAVTAVTVQTHRAVRHVDLIHPQIVAAQISAAIEANPVRAIKVGMLGAAETVEVVSSAIARHPEIPVVLDPVLVSTSGRALLPHGAIRLLQSRLMPLCRLVTPNLPELSVLTGSSPAEDEREILRQGAALLEVGPAALLVKGGHATGSVSTDLLLRKGEPVRRFSAARQTSDVRGTGCMLASAVAAGLALGYPLPRSVAAAKQYVFDRLAAASKRSSSR